MFWEPQNASLHHEGGGILLPAVAKISVPTVNSISNDKHTETEQEKGWKTAHRQDSQAVEVCHGKVLDAKLRGFEAEGEKSQPQVGGVHP